MLIFAVEHTGSLKALSDASDEMGFSVCGALNCKEQVSVERWSLILLLFSCRLRKSNEGCKTGVSRSVVLQGFLGCL